MPGERVQRLLRLITILQRDETNSTESLMQELGVSRRTLFRDLRTLDGAGVPYRHERGLGYRLDKSFHLQPVNLTVPETLGLMMLLKLALTQRQRPLIGSALSAIYKLIATVPDPIREACREMMNNVSIGPDADLIGNRELPHHNLLQRCIDEGRSCRIVYRCAMNPKTLNARIDPYLLHFVNRAWYVLGYVDRYDKVCMLKLTRIEQLDPTDQTFERPTNFRAEDKLGAAWRLHPEGRVYRVELEFDSQVSAGVSEVRWHASQEHELLDDGRCRMTFTVDGLGEIASWVCGYADRVQVIQPPELRDRVRQMHQRAYQRYDSATLS